MVEAVPVGAAPTISWFSECCIWGRARTLANNQREGLITSPELPFPGHRKFPSAGFLIGDYRPRLCKNKK